MYELTLHLDAEPAVYHTLHVAWQAAASQPQLTDIALHLLPDSTGLEVFVNGQVVACARPGLLKGHP